MHKILIGPFHYRIDFYVEKHLIYVTVCINVAFIHNTCQKWENCIEMYALSSFNILSHVLPKAYANEILSGSKSCVNIWIT